MRQFEKEFYTLQNGVKIPKIAFGTWQITGDDAYTSTIFAIDAGYLHIDTALAYTNEQQIGKALKDKNVKRENIFITSKLPAEIKGYNETMEAFNKTITNLGIEYLDLYLIHAPWPWNEIGKDCTKENIESWKAMIELYNAGKIKAIGVSNFSENDINALIDATNFVPHVNQIYYHPGCRRYDIEAYCKEHNILVEAYSPFATGRIFKSTELQEIAKKYNVSVARLALRWCLARNTLPLPKSTHQDRIIDNLNLDFDISEEDLNLIDEVRLD